MFSSHVFYPSVGGLESVSWILAHQFAALGHEIRVLTQTRTFHPEQDQHFPFQIIREPTQRELTDHLRWCEVAFHNNISLMMAWPLLWIRRPWVIAHHTWIRSAVGQSRWQDRVKRSVLQFASNISISRAIAAHLPVASTVIGNPYREELFRIRSEISRDRDLVFLGRLVSDKGADILLHALSQLRLHNLTPNLSVIGSGPEEKSLRQLVEQLDLTSQVTFLGNRTGEELVQILNQHRILVVPSRWQEPFGVVALEGIACGCVAVGSSGGGLPDAIGPCGVTFPNGDDRALARVLMDLVSYPARLEKFRTATDSHLAQHQQEEIAKRYLAVFERSVNR